MLCAIFSCMLPGTMIILLIHIFLYVLLSTEHKKVHTLGGVAKSGMWEGAQYLTELPHSIQNWTCSQPHHSSFCTPVCRDDLADWSGVLLPQFSRMLTHKSKEEVYLLGGNCISLRQLTKFPPDLMPMSRIFANITEQMTIEGTPVYRIHNMCLPAVCEPWHSNHLDRETNTFTIYGERHVFSQHYYNYCKLSH